MTISKLTLLFCALAVGAIGFTARADDNPAQAAARAALAQQLSSQNGPQATNAQATNAVSASEAKAKAKAAAAQAKAEAKAAAKADVEQQDAARRAALAAALADRTNASVQSQNMTSNSMASASAASAGKDKRKKKESTPAAQSSAAVQPAPATGSGNVGKNLDRQPMTGPPLPISASKEARLQALLEKYKADQITPEEYHQQRAAILAEP
ncbi:MAG TPA: hypothetical protein VL970_14005 [Candidatus Acidoferrales bacterium]|nr:hypothetical protein [Candidatus Acidoferrales bacterium]